MKTISLKPVLMTFITVLALSLYGCGGASGSSGETAYDRFNEADVIGDRADMSTSGSIDYSKMFSNVGDTEDYDILTLIGMDNNLSTFAKMARLSNLDLKLNYTGPVTVFAPSNEAFRNMPEEKFERLVDPRNRAQLGKFIQRHILPSKVNAVEFNSTQAIETAAEEEISIDTEAGGSVVYIGGAQVVKSDIEAKDGVVHIVNSVIEPTRDVFTD